MPEKRQVSFFLGYYFVIELLSSKFSPHSQVL
jgi:hypothetical protein